MAYVITRSGKKGDRHTGMYRSEDGSYRSAGTFDDHDMALRTAEAEERHVGAGLTGTSPATKASMTVKAFAQSEFLPNHNAELGTVQSYGYLLGKWVYPVIGGEPIATIEHEILYKLLAKVLPARGASPSTCVQVRVVLSVMFRMAKNHGFRSDLPIADIRLSGGGQSPILIANHAQYARLHDAMPTAVSKLYAALNFASGARQCEMRSFQVGDFEFEARQTLLTVQRSATQLNKAETPGAERFVVKPYPKNKRYRRFVLAQSVSARIKNHIQEHALGPKDLIFPKTMFQAQRSMQETIPPEEIAAMPSMVDPSNGIVYDHGTMGGYTKMKCRCDACRQWSREYSRERKRASRTAKAVRCGTAQDSSGFLTPNIWARIWDGARREAKLPEDFNPYNARHSCLSWMVEQGIDMARIKNQAGHGDLSVTSRYVQILDEQDSSAALALDAFF